MIPVSSQHPLPDFHSRATCRSIESFRAFLRLPATGHKLFVPGPLSAGRLYFLRDLRKILSAASSFPAAGSIKAGETGSAV